MHARVHLSSILLIAIVVAAGCVDPSGAGAELAAEPLAAPAASSAPEPRAGELAPDAAPPATTDASPLAPALRRLARGAVEPTLGVAPSGAMLVSADGDRTDIVRSLDGGVTWESVRPSDGATPFPSNDPFVHVDPTTGRFFALDQYGLTCSWLLVSDDEGDTWRANPLACGAPPGLFDHPSLTTAKARLLPTQERLVVLCANQPNVGSSCAVSADGGRTFGPARPVFPSVQPEAEVPEPPRRVVCGGMTGHVAAAPDGTLYLGKGHCGRVLVASSRDDGLTWNVAEVDARVGSQTHEVRVAADEAGNAYAFWMGLDGLPYLATSRDEGATWSDALRLAPPDVTATDFPALVAGGEGRVAVAFLGTDLEGGYRSLPSAVDGAQAMAAIGWEPPVPEGTAWHAWMGILEGAHGEAPRVEWTRLTGDDPLARGGCGRERCPGVLDFIGMALDPAGRPWVGLVDACHEACVSDPEGASAEREGWELVLGTLARGPSLRDGTPLPPLPWAEATST